MVIEEYKEEETEKKVEDNIESTPKGDEVEKSSVIDQAKKVNDTRLEIVEREEKLQARQEEVCGFEGDPGGRKDPGEGVPRLNPTRSRFE